MPDPVSSIGDVRRAAARRLEALSETASLDAELFMREVLGVDRAGLLVRDRDPLPEDAVRGFESMVSRRLDGEPVAYILKRKGFHSIDLYVDNRVLVPRPETEGLVAIALEWLASRTGALRVVDVGTGSGAIALALAAELADRRDISILATDVSDDALEVARLNRHALGLESRVEIVCSNLLTGVTVPIDLILANLPYLRRDQVHPSIAHEPDVALYAGDDGFDLYRQMFQDTGRVLAAEGLIVAEIDPAQAGIGAEYVRRVTGLPVSIQRDLWDRDRFLLAGNKA